MSESFEDILRRIVGEPLTPSRLVSALEFGRTRLLVSVSTGFTSRQVKLAIVEKLGMIGDESALSVIEDYRHAYLKSGDQVFADAAARAIKAIKARASGDQENAKSASPIAENIDKSKNELFKSYGEDDENEKHSEIDAIRGQGLQRTLLEFDGMQSRRPCQALASSRINNSEIDSEIDDLIALFEELDCHHDIINFARMQLAPNPDDLDCWVELAKGLRSSGCYYGALEAYNIGVRYLSPKKSYLLWANRGLLLLSWERYAEALDSINYSIKLNPDYDGARFLLGGCPRINEGGSFRENCPPNPPRKSF